MKTKEEVQKYVEEELESLDYAEDFSDIDSMDKMEMILRCEAEFFIAIDDTEVHTYWDTETFVDFLYNKIINENHENN
jgi:acyl carrier protein